MCLGVPGRVVAIGGDGGLEADVDFFGVRRKVRLDIVDEPVSVGDYVLNHVGFAIRRIPEEEIGATLELFDTILREARPDDLMAADVTGEIAATEDFPDEAACPVLPGIPLPEGGVRGGRAIFPQAQEAHPHSVPPPPGEGIKGTS